jgi:hypothetical protein
MSDQVQGAGYFESEVETDVTALELEMETDVSQKISKQKRYSAD